MVEARSYSRRAVLSGATAAALARGEAWAAPPGRFIDVHHHFNPPGGYVSPGAPEWSPRIAIEEMDRNGVAAGVGFLGPISGLKTRQEGRARARSWNEFGAQMCRDFPTRFGLFAALPLEDVEGSLAEMEHAYGVLKADGLGVATNYGDRWLGDPLFEPVWREANRRKAVVYVHPTDAPCCTPGQLSYMNGPVSGPWIEWPMNTARTILSLMLAGTLRRYPDIRFIFSHGGGVMPLLVERISGLAGWDAVGPEAMQALFPEGVQAEVARLRFECAQAYAEANFAALTKVVPTSHILFGTDYNRFRLEHSITRFSQLHLDAVTASAIARRNAEALFPRLKT